MSQENVDFVLDRYARLNAGERIPDLDFWHADGVYQAAREDPDSATHRGIDAIRAQFARWYEAYPDLRVEPQEAKSSGDRVFLWVRFSGHGGGSGVPIDMELAHVWTSATGRPLAWSSIRPSRGPRSRGAVGVAGQTRSAALRGPSYSFAMGRTGLALLPPAWLARAESGR